jgi:osmoprotectant transport system permease protein
VIRLVPVALLVTFLMMPERFAPLLQPVAGPGKPAIYDVSPLWWLTLLHLRLVFVSIGAASATALVLAIWVTRPGFGQGLALARSVVSAAQTFPPVAVLALLVPILGFGDGAVFIALFLYGLLPVFETALAELTRISPSVLEAARGCGLTGWQRLVRVELPLSLPGVFSGIRLSLVTGLGLAAIGSTVGSRTLGEVIVAGLLSSNGSYVLTGAGLIALTALGVSVCLDAVCDRLLGGRV